MKKLLIDILKTVGQAAKEKVEGLIPGSDTTISGITKLFDKDNTNNIEGLIEIESGVIAALNALDPSLIDNAANMQAGIVEVKAGFDKIRLALKK